MNSRQQGFGGRLHRSYGLSLIEILVAMVLGLIVLAGATNLFLGSSRTFGVNESLSRMQEDARFALSQLERDVRSAGYTGCSPNVVNRIASNEAMWTDVRGTVMGWENSGTGIGDTLDLTSASASFVSSSGRAVPVNTRPGSDVLEIRSGRTLSEVQPNIIEISNNQANINLGTTRLNRGAGTVLSIISGNCDSGDRFRRTNAAQAGSINTRGTPFTPANIGFNLTNRYTNTATLVLHSTLIYFIAENADGIPSLMMRDVSVEEPVNVELVQGVDSMQLLYGVAASQNSSQVSEYVTAADVDDWSNVVSVRVSMLLRSVSAVNSGPLNRRVFNLLGTTVNPTGGNISSPTGDQNIRLVVTKTMSLRNRLQ